MGMYHLQLDAALTINPDWLLTAWTIQLMGKVRKNLFKKMDISFQLYIELMNGVHDLMK